MWSIIESRDSGAPPKLAEGMARAYNRGKIIRAQQGHSTMPLTPQESQKVRKIIAGLLKVDLEKVVPEAHFWTLGGSFDKLKPLRLKVEKSLKVDITAITNEVNSRTAMKTNGVLTPQSVKSIGQYLGIKYTAPRVRFIDLYTVEFIEAITAKACEKRDGLARPSDEGVISVRFPDYPCSLEVRRIVSRLLNVALEHVNADSDLGVIDGLIVASLLFELNAKWNISVNESLEEVIQAAKANKQRNLTPDSRKKLAELLPSVDFTSPPVIHESVLNRLGILEALVDRDIAGRKGSARVAQEPVFRLTGHAWTEKGAEPLRALQAKFSARMTRQLVAECCRLSLAPKARWAQIARRAIAALQEWTSGGRRSRDVVAIAKELVDWELEGIPTLKALAASLAPKLPADTLILTAQALATKHNLTQLGAVKRVQKAAAALESDAS